MTERDEVPGGEASAEDLPLDRGLRSAFAEDPPTEVLPERFDGYRIVGRLGSGGMGVVYDAVQANPNRRVALKVIRPGHATRELRRRFAREADLLGRLQHPGIAQIYESGIADQGLGPQPYVVMERVEGVPLGEWEGAVSREVRVELVARIADAVHHAHQRSVVHRDLKPANVLIQEDGAPKVLDFGVGRLLGDGDDTRSLVTSDGQLVGTLPYMSPEQLKGDPRDVDTRADIYALGVMLYEVLSGRRPLEVSTTNLAASIARICTQDPTPLGRLDPTLRGDLETIAAKAMSKAPDRRYGSAAALAEDLRRVNADEPILARPTTAAYRVRKFVARNKPFSAAVALAFVLLVAGLVVNRVLFVETEAALGRARLRGLVTASALAESTDPALALLLAREAARIEITPDVLSRLQAALQEALGITIYGGHEAPVRNAEYAPDGQRVLSCAWDGTARIWDVSGRPVSTMRGHTGKMRMAVYAPDGARILTMADDHVPRLWDGEGRLLAELVGHTGPVRSAAFAPDGRHIVTASGDGTARLWHADGSPAGALAGHSRGLTGARFSPGGERVLTTSNDGTARLWSRNGELLRSLLHDAGAADRPGSREFPRALWSPDGAHILTWGEDARAVLWDVEGRLLFVQDAHAARVNDAAFSPDGRLVVTASADSTARLWDLGGRTLATFGGHAREVARVAFAPDGETIATGSVSGVVRIWTRSGREIVVLRGHTARIVSIRYGARSGLLLTGSADGTSRQWDLEAGGLATLRGHQRSVSSARFSPRGDRILTSSRDHTARLWDLSGRPLVVFEGHELGLLFASFSPSGDRVATASFDTTARIWDLEGREAAVYSHRQADGDFVGRPVYPYSALLDTAGRLLTGASDGGVRLWDPAGEPHVVCRGHDGVVMTAVRSADGTMLLTASSDMTARLWSADGEPLVTIDGHEEVVNSACFSPSGQAILTASDDKTARLWSLEGELITEFRGHGFPVQHAVFSPDGTRVLTASADGTARLWDLQANVLQVLRGHRGGLRDCAFSPSGKIVVTASTDRTVRLWYTEAADILRLADERIARDFTSDERRRYADLLEPGR